MRDLLLPQRSEKHNEIPFTPRPHHAQCILKPGRLQHLVTLPRATATERGEPEERFWLGIMHSGFPYRYPNKNIYETYTHLVLVQISPHQTNKQRSATRSLSASPNLQVALQNNQAEF